MDTENTLRSLAENNANFQEAEREQHRFREEYERSMAKATPKNRRFIFEKHVRTIYPKWFETKSLPARARMYVVWVWQNPCLGDEIPTNELEYVLNGFSVFRAFEAQQVQLVARKLVGWTLIMRDKEKMPVHPSAYKTSLMLERTAAGKTDLLEKTAKRLQASARNFDTRVSILKEQLVGERLSKDVQERVASLEDIRHQAHRLITAGTPVQEGSSQALSK